MTSFSSKDNLNNSIDYKLDALFNNKTNGFYIELGANDGITQSNTAFFAFHRNWKGVLIEPSPVQYEACVRNRPESHHFNYACVSTDYNDEYVSGDFNGSLMASINGKRLNSSDLIQVKANTLTKILDSINPSVTDIDLLSLDTEGYELNILKGLNFDKYRPRYILIEIYTDQYESILVFLQSKGYILHSNFTNYNKTTNPYWDGTHNDYLFMDNM